MAGPKITGSRSGRINQGIGKASVAGASRRPSNIQAKSKMNSTLAGRNKANGLGPSHGNKTSAAANARKQSRATMDRGRRARASAPPVKLGGSSSSGGKRQLTDYAGNPGAFLSSYFSGGVLGPKKK